MRKEKGFTLIELLVVISIIALLLSILMPSLTKAKYQAKRIVCLTNMRGQGVIQALYAADYNGKYPPHDDYSPEYARSPDVATGNGAENSLYNAIVDYIENVDIMNCPILTQQSASDEEFAHLAPDFYEAPVGWTDTGNWRAFSTQPEMDDLVELKSILGGYMWLSNYRCTWSTPTDPTEPIFNFTDSYTGIDVDEDPWPKRSEDATSRTAVLVHRISGLAYLSVDFSHLGKGYTTSPGGLDDFATGVDNPIGRGDGSVSVTKKSSIEPRADAGIGVVYY